jgi:hypothetical protein
MRLLCPGEPEWPTRLDDLGDAWPVVLWVGGRVDLRFACLQSVSVVGARRRGEGVFDLLARCRNGGYHRLSAGELAPGYGACLRYGWN